ncbi:hypothetical protein [Nostoc sp. DedQUE09]|uniref:hypothetical protein n=1 Tax=Nostoc sp. DedQUE09 TaxID=3075394 RepID=UPI002AD3980B|nr:hypothetical protein [Nostoc sp. DedQUE09]MDZ7955688.1 hypothetical protein [Nostoc sp. DedQUE09]
MSNFAVEDILIVIPSKADEYWGKIIAVNGKKITVKWNWNNYVWEYKTHDLDIYQHLPKSYQLPLF